MFVQRLQSRVLLPVVCKGYKRVCYPNIGKALVVNQTNDHDERKKNQLNKYVFKPLSERAGNHDSKILNARIWLARGFRLLDGHTDKQIYGCISIDLLY